MEKYFDINQNGHSIRCKLYYSDLHAIRRIVISAHGFAGHKDNRAAAKFADRAVSSCKGTAVVTFDWPCHGKDGKKKLKLEDCCSYLRILLQYLTERFAPDTYYAYGTSFGGYVLLKYIHDNGSPFIKTVLRCPAVNMYGSMTQRVMSEKNREDINRGKTVSVGFDRQVSIDSAFLSELKECDLTKFDYLDYAEDILIIHGTKDEVIPIETVKAFCDDNLIELLPIEKADHRFQDPQTMDAAIHAALSYFQFR